MKVRLNTAAREFITIATVPDAYKPFPVVMYNDRPFLLTGTDVGEMFTYDEVPPVIASTTPETPA